MNQFQHALCTNKQTIYHCYLRQFVHWTLFEDDRIGIRQSQHTLIVAVDLTRLDILLFLCTGNIENTLVSKHLINCSLIAVCSIKHLPRSSPRQRAVANAIANGPQSFVRYCIWTSTYFSDISDFLVASSDAICSFMGLALDKIRLEGNRVRTERDKIRLEGNRIRTERDNIRLRGTMYALK